MKHLYSIIFVFSIISFSSAKGKYNESVYPTDSKFIYDACVSENGKVIICTNGNSLKAFSTSSKEVIATFVGGHRDNILCVALSPDSSLVASGGCDSAVVIWDSSKHTIIRRIGFANGKITSIKFSPDNQYILFGCSNAKAYLYNIKEQKEVKEFSDQKLDVTTVAFSYDGSRIAIAGGDKIIRLYSSTDFQLKRELKEHTNWIRSICFYNYGQNLISCGDDKRIIQWNLSKQNFKKVKMHRNWNLSVDIENNDINKNLYVVGTMSGFIRINHSFGCYNAKLKSPISKVIFLPSKSGTIGIAVATLGSGLMTLSAVNMDFSK